MKRYVSDAEYARLQAQVDRALGAATGSPQLLDNQSIACPTLISRRHPAPSNPSTAAPPAPSTQHPAPSTQHPAPSTQHPAPVLSMRLQYPDAAASLEARPSPRHPRPAHSEDPADRSAARLGDLAAYPPDVGRRAAGQSRLALSGAPSPRRAGLGHCRWGVSDQNRQAKFYQLTRAGEKQLARETETWAQISAAVTRIVEA